MMKISAVIITFNEERNIARCLDSLQQVADEIVVLDSGSTDQTESICKVYGVRFFRQGWRGYGAQKNDANRLATYDMILSLDADEALSEELKYSILAIKSESRKESVVYELNRFTNYCGKWIKHCGWYPDSKIRIFDKNFAFWKNMRVHEDLGFSATPQIVHLKGDLLHYSFYTINEHILTVNKYTTLAAEEAFMKGKKKSLFSILMSTVWRFFRDYFIKGGFKDGFYGFVICGINAFSRFLRYVKLRQLHFQSSNR